MSGTWPPDVHKPDGDDPKPEPKPKPEPEPDPEPEPAASASAAPEAEAPPFNRPAAKAALTAYTIPVVAVTFGAIVLAEPVTPRTLLGAAMILAGVAVVARRR